MLDAETLRQIEGEVETEVAAAFTFAEESPFPDELELYSDVYKEV